MFWTFLENNTHDGNKLELVAPFQVEITASVATTIASREEEEVLGFVFNGETVFRHRNKFFDTEKDATKGLIRSINDFYSWHSNPNNAPTSNVPAWEKKAENMMEYLKIKYLHIYPEVFI